MSDDEIAVHLEDKGLGRSAIAKAMGVSIKDVVAWLKK
jgi:transposase-like protein